MRQILSSITRPNVSNYLTTDILNLTEWLSPVLPWAGAAIFLVVIVLAFRARAARVDRQCSHVRGHARG